jgi:hypothetical protein
LQLEAWRLKNLTFISFFFSVFFLYRFWILIIFAEAFTELETSSIFSASSRVNSKTLYFYDDCFHAILTNLYSQIRRAKHGMQHAVQLSLDYQLYSYIRVQHLHQLDQNWFNIWMNDFIKTSNSRLSIKVNDLKNVFVQV